MAIFEARDKAPVWLPPDILYVPAAVTGFAQYCIVHVSRASTCA